MFIWITDPKSIRITLQYRPEIDGLRAIAILAVVAYHANLAVFGFNVFEAGFYGVDVFFVISGYLISRIIYDELETHQALNFFRFYERRVRRILPVLLLVSAFSLILSWFLLLPDDFLEFSKSVIASLLFLSNFFFYVTTTDYGAQSSLLMPFLHTWSLSIEEQFYLVFPFFAYVVHRVFKRHVFTIVTALFAASLIFSEINSYQNEAMNFYLPHARAWEILAGVLIARLEFSKTPVISNPFRFCLAALGIILVIAPMLILPNSIRHPSLFTVFPVAGVCLVIFFSNGHDPIGKLLSTRPLVFVGLISYSLYLWHFPLFAFWRLVEEPFGVSGKLLIIVTSVVLSCLSYYTVEKFFRNRAQTSTRFALGSIYLSAALLIGCCFWIIQSAGVPSRFGNLSDTSENHLSGLEYRRFAHPEGVTGTRLIGGNEITTCGMRDPKTACKIGNEKFVTLGDSYVGHYEPALMEILNERGDGLISYSYEQCPFVPPTMWFGQVAECPYVNEERLRYIGEFSERKTFLISANESQFDCPKARTRNVMEDAKKRISSGECLDKNLAWTGYIQNIQFLTNLGHRIVLVTTLPRPNTNVRQQFFNMIRARKIDDKRFEPKFSAANASDIRDFNAANFPDFDNEDIIVVNPVDLICPERDGQSPCMIIDEKGPLYGHDRHVSHNGARLILDAAFEEMDRRGWD